MGWVRYLLTSAGFGRQESSDESQDNVHVHAWFGSGITSHMIWNELINSGR